MGPARSAKRFMLVALLGVLGLGIWGAYAVLAAPSPPAPSITASPANPTNSTSASFAFNDTQTGVTFQCSLDGVAFAACSSPKTYPSVAVGSHIFQVQAVSGGKASSSASYSWVVDTTAPSVSTINRADANPTKASSLHWTVTFSEPVKNVTTANFTPPATSGTAGIAPTVTSVTSTGSAPAPTWTVTVATAGTTGSNTATVGLNLTGKGSIQDAAGNPLGGSPPVIGQTYNFDTQAPTVLSISRASAALTNASSVSWTVTFSEPITGGATSNFSLVQGGGITGTPAVTSVSGSGMTRTVTASTGTTTPASGAAVSLQLNLSTATGVADLAGNALAAGLNGTASAYQVDKVAPVPLFDSTPPDPNGVSTSNFTWHDGEAGVTYLCSTENGGFSSTVQSASGPAQPCSSPLTYVVQTTNNGQHQFAVEAVDAAGNISSGAFYSWKVDKGSIQDFTIDGNAVGLLYPAGPARTIAVTLHNPNSIPIYVTAVTVTLHTADFPAGCASAGFTITPASIPAAGVLVPAGGAVTLPAQGATAPTVHMLDSGNQNACRNLSFHFDYAGSAHS